MNLFYKRNAHGDWRKRVASLVAQHCQSKFRDANRTTSNRTQEKAYENVMRLFEWLRTECGFKGLANPMSLDERHFKSLAQLIKDKKDRGDFGAAQAAGYATYCRHIARWIGKPQLVTVFGEELGKTVCKRNLIAQTDKSWEAKDVDPEEKIKEILKHNRWVGLVLCAQHTYGLRKMEAMMLRPLTDIRPIKTVGGTGKEWTHVNLFISHGAKGGRPRVFEVTDHEGLEMAKALREEIKAFGDRDHFPPANKSLHQNIGVYNRTMTKFGLTRKDLEVTGHGLRAAYACNKLEEAGITPTVRGGDGQHEDPVIQSLAYHRVTEAMGHGRISVIGAYAGSITPPSAAKLKKEQQRIDRRLAIQALQAEQLTEGATA